MSKTLKVRILAERIVDTKKCRYILDDDMAANKGKAIIKRLPIALLNTTRAIDGWETVAIIR